MPLNQGRHFIPWPFPIFCTGAGAFPDGLHIQNHISHVICQPVCFRRKCLKILWDTCIPPGGNEKHWACHIGFSCLGFMGQKFYIASSWLTSVQGEDIAACQERAEFSRVGRVALGIAPVSRARGTHAVGTVSRKEA